MSYLSDRRELSGRSKPDRAKRSGRVAAFVIAATLGLATLSAGPAGLPANATQAAQVGVQVLSAPATVAAGHSATIDVTAAAGTKCRLTLARGTRKWKSKTARLADPATTALQFPWTQTAGKPGKALKATVTCRSGRVNSAQTVPVRVAKGAKHKGRTSKPKFGRPALVTLNEVNPVEGLGGNAGSPPWGTVLVPGSQWLGGGGVDVVSNGTSTLSYNGYNVYGVPYQCVELANRLVMTKNWSGKVSGNAQNYYANASAGSFDKHPASGSYLPVPGDIMVWGGGSYGHVAVVNTVSGGVVNFVEQNASATGRNALSIDSAGHVGRYSGLAFIGYLHAKANTVAGPPQPAPKGITCSQFVADLTIPDGTVEQPGATFTKSWQLRNCGTVDWSALHAVRVSGDFGPTTFAVPDVAPGATGTVSVNMTAPTGSGTYRSTYRLADSAGNFAANDFWVQIVVPTPAPPPAPVNRHAVASYDQLRGGASRAEWYQAWQDFKAASNTLTRLSINVGDPRWAAGLIPVTTTLRLCLDAGCSQQVGSWSAQVNNYGATTAEIGDFAVTPGTTYFLRYDRPDNAHSWSVYFWGPGTYSNLSASAYGYNR